MKKVKPNGGQIKAYRQARERAATQKEFAHEIGVSERKLRQIENGNAEITVPILDRIAKALRVRREAIAFAIDGPRAVPTLRNEADNPTGSSTKPETVIVPRFDTAVASFVRDEGELFKGASSSHTVVSQILAKLNAQTEGYADELLELLQSLSWEKRDCLVPIDGRHELRVRSRIRELLVLLKGNDVWVYATTHFKRLPESYDIQPKEQRFDGQMQLIVAFGPPGEYGEDTVLVQVDHGQPWSYEPGGPLPF